MERKERLKIAKELSKRILEAHKENILAIGVYGSMARKEDQKYSDIDMIIITKKEGKEEGKFFLHSGMSIEYEFVTKKEAIENIKNVNRDWPDWPQEATMYTNPLPLYDPNKTFKKFKTIVGGLNPGEFNKAAERALLILYEETCKVKNAELIKDKVNLLTFAREAALVAQLFVALVNKKYYSSNRNILKESQKFSKLPKDYKKLVMVASGYNRETQSQVYKATLKLLDNCSDLAKKEGLKFAEYNDLKQLKY